MSLAERLLRLTTWTAGWSIGGVTAPVDEWISWTLGERRVPMLSADLLKIIIG